MLHAVPDNSEGEDPMDDPETRADAYLHEAIRNITATMLADEASGRSARDDERFLALAAAHNHLCRIAGD